MKILVTGTNGVLGQEVIKASEGRAEIRGCSINEIDITQRHQIISVIQDFRPNVLINCAGLVKYRPVKDSQYIRVNALAPHIIAEHCDWFNIRLIHISSDCVFSGLDGPYNEKSIPNPTDLYGRSKLAGEVTRKPHLTVRSSFIGFGERGLLTWLLRQSGKITGYDLAFWSGLTVPILARILIDLAFKDDFGILHVYGEPISKYDLLVKLAGLFKLNIRIDKGPTPIEHQINRSLVTITDLTPEVFSIPDLDTMLKDLYEVHNAI
jgi:dTDP-4-dehydrorhamnose reductase